MLTSRWLYNPSTRKTNRCCHIALRELHDFINYEEVESQVQKELNADNDWIKSLRAMQTMKLGRHEPSNHLLSQCMHEHIIARGYENHIGDIEIPDESARRVLSSCLTFPLTMSYAYKLLLPMVPPRLNVLVVGARAESSLPPVWWKDCLYNNSELQEISIKMTGPGIQIPKNTAIATSLQPDEEILDWKFIKTGASDVPELQLNDDKLQNQNQIARNPDSASVGAVSTTALISRATVSMPYTVNNLKLLHENEDALQLLQWADVFVLYNPGE